jgi:hypothetical protein
MGYLNEQTEKYKSVEMVRGIAWNTNSVFPCMPNVQSVLLTGGRPRCNNCAVMTAVLKNVTVATIELLKL